jgi:hypothetical protein
LYEFGVVRVGSDVVSTGDMPIILTCDGPSLGGFVCPATTILADMWKWGQARPGDKIQFALTTVEDAVARLQLQKARFAAVKAAADSGEAIDEAALKVCPAVQQSFIHVCLVPRFVLRCGRLQKPYQSGSAGSSRLY